MDKVTEKLAGFITNALYTWVLREALDVGKLNILDTLRCLIAGPGVGHAW
jgi:hypothetical protein